jgi:hypothetical protein
MTTQYSRLAVLFSVFLMSVPAAFAQFAFASMTASAAANGGIRDAGSVVAELPSTVSPPRMSPELALQVYEQHQEEQRARLAAYSDDTIMIADLPDSKQKGEYELKRTYAAPNTLKFTPVKYVGDGFVKSNVLVRLLQSEVDHTVKGQGAQTAIDEANYKFTHKSTEMFDGRMVYVYHVKPRKKRVGLFKGKVYIDASNGDILRAEGTMVKSPSIFIKKLEFVQDYAEFAGFVLPTQLHSIAKVRIIGRTIVDVFHRDYQPTPAQGGVKSASMSAPTNTSGTN